MNKSVRHALIGFAECLPAPEVTWSLLDEGFRVTAFSREGAKPLLRRFREVEIVPIHPPEANAELAWLDLESVTVQSGASVFVPLDDQSLWMCGRLDGRISIAAPRAEHVKLALNKREQVERALEAGFAVPQTQVATARELREDRRIPFPFILRPVNAVEERDGRLKRTGALVCADEAELESALIRLGELRVLVQPLLDGVSEGLFGLATGGRGSAWSAHRRIRMVDPQGSGSSACVSTPVQPDLVGLAEQFIREVGWQGMFMFEFLRDRSGTPWFVEFNGRAWGSMALARRIGFEYPAWTARIALDPHAAVDPPPIRAGVVCRHLGQDLKHAVAVFRGPRSNALVWPSRWRTLRDVLTFRRSDTWYNLHPGHRMLFVEDTAAAVSEICMRFARRIRIALPMLPRPRNTSTAGQSR